MIPQAAAQPAAARDANPKSHHGGAEADEPRAGRDDRAVQLERFRQGEGLRAVDVKVAVGRRDRPQGARDQAGEVVHGDRSQQPLPAAEKDRDAAWTCRGKLSVKYVGRKKVNGTPLKRR
jgi:hypothetical protein